MRKKTNRKKHSQSKKHRQSKKHSQSKKTTRKQNRNKNSATTSKSRFNSGDGMLTAVWGPSMWHFLHIMSFNYPVHPTVEDKKNYYSYIMSLQHVLPCKYCRVNLGKNLIAHPLTATKLKSRAAFSKYIYELHEVVNKLLHKKSGLTYLEVRKRYEHFRSRCTESDYRKRLFKFKKTRKGVGKKKEKAA